MSIVTEIEKLKKEKNAIILAHYYVPAEVQEIADFIGDSFALAKKAKTTDADCIVFAGVRFMGESAKILNPDKKVLMPDLQADCPMAHMAYVDRVKMVREQYDDVAVVCYINSTAELKGVSDVCVTSSNAVRIVKNLPQKNIYFIPDQNLATFVEKQVPEKNFIKNDGFCVVHHRVTKEEVLHAKEKNPNALVLVHPESKKEVCDQADFVGSTSEIINFATKSDAKEFIIGTELGVMFELEKRNPDKKFIPMVENQICENMKKVTLQKVYEALKYEKNEVIMDDKISDKALYALNNMMEMGK